jgi:site-specific DNA-methyltransferase (adenine-specific)
LLPDNGRCGFVLPSSYLSFSSALLRWHDQFSIRQDALPRDLFPRISVPLSFFLFTREKVRRLQGFFLFEECGAIKGSPKHIRLVLKNGQPRTSVWKVAVAEAVRALGGRACLADIYGYLEGKQPRKIQFWRDTVRRVLQEGGFVNLDRGVWAIV